MPNWIAFFTWCLTLNTMVEKWKREWRIFLHFRKGIDEAEIYVHEITRKDYRSWRGRKEEEKVCRHSLKVDFHWKLHDTSSSRCNLFLLIFQTQSKAEEKKVFSFVSFGCCLLHPSRQCVPPPSLCLIRCHQFHFASVYLSLALKGECFLLLTRMCQEEKRMNFYEKSLLKVLRPFLMKFSRPPCWRTRWKVINIKTCCSGGVKKKWNEIITHIKKHLE